MREQKIEDENYIEAIKIIDKILPILPEDGNFNLMNQIDAIKSFKTENERTYQLNWLIYDLFIKKFKYSDGNPFSIINLNDKGKEAKKAGGHFKYLKQQAKKDFTKKSYRLNYITAVTAILALIVTIVLAKC